MKPSADTAVFRAFLKALNESKRDYLVCGDLAASYHAGARKIQTLEIWLGPEGKGVASEMTVWAKLTRLIGPDSPGQADSIDRIRLRRGTPPFAFEVAYAARKVEQFFDQTVSLVSRDHMVALKLADAFTPSDVEQASRLMREVRLKESQPPTPPLPRNPDDPPPALHIVPKRKLGPKH